MCSAVCDSMTSTLPMLSSGMEDDLPAALSLPQRFTLVSARAAASPVVACSCCPTMDLIAVITAAQQLHVHRLAWERLFMLQLEPPTLSAEADWSLRCVVWRPDGKALAVGCSDGSVQLVSMESRRVELHYKQHAAAITALHWTQHSDAAAAGSSRRQEQRVWRKVRAAATSFPLKDRTHRFFPSPLPPLLASASSGVGPAPSPVPFQTSSAAPLPPQSGDVSCDGERLPPSLLLSGDGVGVLHARLHGTMDVLHLDLSRSWQPQQQQAAIVGVTLAGSYGSLAVTLLGGDGELRCLTLPLTPLSSRVYELSLLACHLQHIARLLSYAGAAVAAVLARYAAIRSSLSLKFAPLAASIAEHAAAPALSSAPVPSTAASSPQQELIRLLLTSRASPALLHFVTSSLHAPALQRQYNTLSSSLYRMADALQSNVKRAAEEAVFRLAELRGLGRWKDRGDGLGVEEEAMRLMLAEAGAVMLRVEQAVVLTMRVRRCFGSFFPWLSRAVSLLSGDEEEKAQPAQPVDVDDVLECINRDLFTDRLGALLSDAALAAGQQPAELSTPPPLPPSVSLIASGPSVATLLSALDTVRASFLKLTSSPSSAISQRVMVAAEQRWQSPLRIKLAGGEEEGRGEVALCYDGDSRTQKLAFSTIHPLLPYPLIVVCASPLRPPAAGVASSRSVLALSCPGLTSSSHPTVVSVSFFSASLLLVLVRYSVQRRSSELRHLHEQQRMPGNCYTRLWQLDLQQLQWTKAEFSAGMTAAEWAVREVEDGRLAVQTVDGQDGVRQRCLYGECGRSVVSGRERGVCCLLLTALQPHRARQQRRRVLLLDMVEDVAEEEEQADAAAADGSGGMED